MPRARRPTPRAASRLGPAAALAGSLLAHGAVLAAAVLLVVEPRPPEPLRAVLVELASPGSPPAAEPDGPGAARPAETAVPSPGEAAPAAAAGGARAPAPEPAAALPPAPPAAGPATRPPRPPPRPARPARPSAPEPEPASAPRASAVGTAAALGGDGGRGDRDGAAEPAPRAGGGLEPPGFAPGSADNPLPRYPSAARRRGIEGTVTLAVRVSAQGLADGVTIDRSSGSTLLDEAARDAVRRWRFRPARLRGEPVEGSVAVPITFRLVDPERIALP